MLSRFPYRSPSPLAGEVGRGLKHARVHLEHGFLARPATMPDLFPNPVAG